jgi:hypothetical protein
MSPIWLCCTCIIHDYFFTFFTQSHPASLFRFPMGPAAFFGLSIFVLRFSMRFLFGFLPTSLTTVPLASPTTPADAKQPATPSTGDFLVKNRKLR